jgi:hypothetical protein
MVGPQARRTAAQAMRAKKSISERHACELMSLSRTALHYKARAPLRNDELRARIAQLAAKRRPLLVSRGPN